MRYVNTPVLLAMWVALAQARGSTPAPLSFSLTGDTPWVVLGETNGFRVNGDSAEGTAYDLALRDVAADWYKVLGYTPIISKYTATASGAKAGRLPMPALYLGTLSSPWLTELFDLSACELSAGAEAHCVIEQGGSLVATGNTTRGAIYALYTLAQDLLGVDPWYHFSQHQPTFQRTVNVPHGFASLHQPPGFKYRGVFTNDEDMLGHLRPDPLGQGLFDARTADQIYETVLRNKANLVIPGTTTNPDEPHIALASRRGLAIAHSHFEIVGLGTFRWLDGRAAPKQAYNWSSHPDLCMQAWRSCVRAQKDYEVVWTVGLRGLSDFTYCVKGTPEGSSDELCGNAITTAMGNQTAMIREMQPNADIVTYLWDEALKLYQDGHLTIPAGVRVVSTDDGHGTIGATNATLKLSSGIYYHTAMNDGVANQLSELVPPSRVYTQLQRFVEHAKELFMLIDNISDLFPVLLSTQAVLQFAYNPSAGNAHQAEQRFFTQFATEQFGVAVAPQIVPLYSAYFTLPHIVRGNSDQWISMTLRHMAQDFITDLSLHRSPLSVATILAANTALKLLVPSLAPAQAGLRDALLLLNASNRAAWVGGGTGVEPIIPRARRGFFRAQVVYQLSLQYYGLVAMQQLALAVLAPENAVGMGSRSSYVNASLAACASLFDAQRAAEGDGEWRGLFGGDRMPLAGLQDTRRLVLRLRNVLNFSPGATPPGGDPCNWWGPDHCLYSFTHYQKAESVLPFYPLSRPTLAGQPDGSLRDFIMANCSSSSSWPKAQSQAGGRGGGGHGEAVPAPSSWCLTNASGGVYQGRGALVALWSTRCRTAAPLSCYRDPGSRLLPLERCAVDGLVVLYTVNGGPPTRLNATGETRVYTGPIPLPDSATMSAAVTVRAAVEVNGVMRPTVRVAVFVAQRAAVATPLAGMGGGETLLLILTAS